MNREQFFQELRTALHREGFVPQPEQDELLPVEWDGLPLCRITADGSVRYNDTSAYAARRDPRRGESPMMCASAGQVAALPGEVVSNKGD